MLDEDPLFVPLSLEEPLENPWQAFYLSEPDTDRTDQEKRSPCVREPEDPDPEVAEGTTRTDGEADRYPLDLGYHYPTTL